MKHTEGQSHNYHFLTLEKPERIYILYKGEIREVRPISLEFGTKGDITEHCWMLHTMDLERGPRTYKLQDIRLLATVHPDVEGKNK